MIAQKKLYLFSLLSFVIICNWNGTLVNENESSSSKDINFYGTLEDHHRTGNVQHILIGGKYEAIPVYQTISKKELRKKDSSVDPKQNKILLDLKEVHSITLKHPETPTASEIEVNGRKYVEIAVTSNHKSKKHYLIESFRKLKCQEADKHPEKGAATIYEERELNFIHVKKLTIKGWKSGSKDHDSSTAEYRKPKEATSESKKTGLKKDAADIIDKIEQNVKDLPKGDPSLFEQMKKSILSLLKSLRSQLQKIVDMIQ